MDNFKEKLENVFKKYNIFTNNAILTQFYDYFCKIIEYNKKINLTNITEENEVIVKHFLDSVFPNNFIEKNSSVLDIGAGAGFPSIPLKIVRDDLRITMLDSLNKRVNFLNEVINSLSLKSISAVHMRAEDFTEREKFDYVVARAVAKLPTLVEYALPFLKIGGVFIAYKSDDVQQEVELSFKAIEKLGGKLSKIEYFSLEGNKRSVVIIKKIKQTDKKFPRAQNLPKLKPL